MATQPGGRGGPQGAARRGSALLPSPASPRRLEGCSGPGSWDAGHRHRPAGDRLAEQSPRGCRVVRDPGGGGRAALGRLPGGGGLPAEPGRTTQKLDRPRRGGREGSSPGQGTQQTAREGSKAERRTHKAKEVRAPGRTGLRLQAWTQGYRIPGRGASGSDFCPLSIPHAPQGTAARPLSQVRRYGGGGWPVAMGMGLGDRLPDLRLGWWTPLPAHGDEPGRGTCWGRAWLQTPRGDNPLGANGPGAPELAPPQADGKGEPLREPRGGREPGRRRPGSPPRAETPPLRDSGR